MWRVGCWVSLVLLAAFGASEATKYGVVTGRHPSTPLLEGAASSRVHCGLRCLYHRSCVSWGFTALQCSLYGGVTSDPTAATTVGPLWADLWIPNGYQMVPGTARAFKANEQRKDKALIITEECALDHAKAAPAFLETEEQVDFAKSLISIVVWTGIKQVQDKIYGDFPNTRTVALPPGWFAPGVGYGIGLPCVRMFLKGLDFNNCNDSHGYLCEFELLA